MAESAKLMFVCGGITSELSHDIVSVSKVLKDMIEDTSDTNIPIIIPSQYESVVLEVFEKIQRLIPDIQVVLKEMTDNSKEDTPEKVQQKNTISLDQFATKHEFEFIPKPSDKVIDGRTVQIIDVTPAQTLVLHDKINLLDYLNCEPLMYAGLKAMASCLNNRTPQEIAALMDVPYEPYECENTQTQTQSQITE